MNIVGKSIAKKDAMQLLTGKPVYTDDLIPDGCLIVKVLRSPYANAIIKSIDTSNAKKIDGVEAIFTWEDIPEGTTRYTAEEKAYPELCPYDRLILDRHVRFVGDAVAIIAATDEKTALKAMKLIKVQYDVLEPLLDYTKAKDNKIIVHPEDDWKVISDFAHADQMRNIVAHQEAEFGIDIDEAESHCDVFTENTFHVKACQQTPMETFRAYCSIDPYGRLYVLSATQAVFHARKALAYALNIPKGQIRMVKPRIGGGFGSKDNLIAEVFPAFVTWMTKKPSKIIYTREENMYASSPRHEMQVKVRMGATKDGIIRSLRLETLSNTGAYGEHGPMTTIFPTVVPVSLYSKMEGYKCTSDVVYTNLMPSGAYRGYGVTQFTFAVDSCASDIAHKLNMDPFDLHQLNAIKEGEFMIGFQAVNNSCALNRCLKTVREMIDWDNKYPYRRIDDHTVRSVGMAMCCQGSGIANISVGGATLRMSDDGEFILSIGSGEMGQGCDTTLAQIAAEVLKCDIDRINVFSADTDNSPYDTGSYASSTAYVTGKAVQKAAYLMVVRIKSYFAKQTDSEIIDIEYDGEKVWNIKDGSEMTIKEMANKAVSGFMDFEVTASHTSTEDPPPFMAGAVELEIDTDTGETKVIEYDAAIDCGTPINPNICKGQLEGAIVQGLGMALTEDIIHDDKGRVLQNSLMQYKIPSRVDIGNVNVVFESSYEESGAFGVKSIGEVGINTSAPAVAEAIYNATGVRFTELPILPEHIALKKQK